ncbi:hypothetical protein MASR2M64_00300 [Candidatus Cloacimonadota bacterium]
MFLDVSGFTKMTEYAHDKGHYGIEIVTNVLNGYFGKLSDVVYRNGGDILKYGGDSCLIYFHALNDPSKIKAICDEVDLLCIELDAQYKTEYGFGFSVHGGATIGKFYLNIVGDISNHLAYYLYSHQISQLYSVIEEKFRKSIGFLLPDTPIEIHPDAEVLNYNVLPEMFVPKAIIQHLQSEDVPSELRNAVILFLHLAPAEGEEIPLDHYQQYYLEVMRWVDEFGGVINKIDFTEKGYMILILFGIPFARADDVERAFLCAQRLVDKPANNLNCKIGITNSNIYCGFIGSNKRWEYGIIGNAVNVAARLLSFAKAGQIALTEEIVPVIETRFSLRYIESSHVRGIKDPIKIYLLENELPEHWSANQQLFTKLPFVLGNKLLDTLVSFVSSSNIQALSIVGGQGRGKTYLVWLVANLSREQDMKVEICVADKSRQFLRFEFFFNLLRKKMGIVSFKNEFYLLSNYANEHHLDWNEKLLFRYLFLGAENTQYLSKEETELALSNLSELCMDLLYAYDVFAIDNLDGYDTESLVLINRLTTLCLASGKRVIFSSSTEGILTIPDGYSLNKVQLHGFKYTQTEAVINEVLPLVSKSANALLHKICGGNPQFLIALVHQIKGFQDLGNDLITDKAIIDWQAKGRIPSSLENLLMTDFQSMPSDIRDILKLISIFGRPFTVYELASIFEISDVEALALKVSDLVKQHVLELYNRVGNPVYDFANPLLQDYIYRSILHGEKKSLHLKIAAAFAEDTYRQDELLQSIVYHYLQAGDNAGILKWSTIAADRFFKAGAWSISRDYYRIITEHSTEADVCSDATLKIIEVCILLADNEKAKALLDTLPPLKDYHKEYAIYLMTLYYNNIADYVSLQKYLKTNLHFVHDLRLRSLVDNVYFESRLYSNDLGSFFKDATKAYNKLKDNPVALNRLVGIIAQANVNRGDYKQAEIFYREKLSIAENLGDQLSVRIAYNGLGVALSRMGKKQEALEQYQKALNIAESEGDRNGYAKVIMNLGVHHRNAMEYDEALVCYQKSLMLSRHIGNLMQESITLFDMGELLFYQTEFDHALEYFNLSLDIAIKINDYTGISFCRDAMGDVCYKKGDYAGAKSIYLENLALQKGIHDTEGIAHTWGNLGNIAKQEKNYAEARKLYYRQFTILSKIGDIDGAGRARFNLAMINVEQGYFKRALQQLGRAKELFTQCNAQFYLDLCNQQESEILVQLNHPLKPSIT